MQSSYLPIPSFKGEIVAITMPSTTEPWDETLDDYELDPKEFLRFIIYENSRRATLRGINPANGMPFRTKQGALDALADCAKTRPFSAAERRERQLMLVSLEYLVQEAPTPTIDVRA